MSILCLQDISIYRYVVVIHFSLFYNIPLYKYITIYPVTLFLYMSFGAHMYAFLLCFYLGGSKYVSIALEDIAK